jgi:ATP-dependent Clp protease adaptor protein ClpS
MSRIHKDLDDVIVRDDPGKPDVRTRTRLKSPSMYNVVMLNDDFTPMDFVVALLMRVFHHTPEAATAIMMEIHEKGKGIAGTYSREIAEMKLLETGRAARMAEHPLKAVLESV